MNINKNSICIVAPRKGMGDCISFFGIFKTIYKYSKKKIILVTVENTSAKKIFKSEKIFKKIIYFEQSNKNFFSVILSYLKIFRALSLAKSLGANEVIILHQSPKYVLISKILGFRTIEAPGQKFQRFFLKINRVYENFLSKKLLPIDECKYLVRKIFLVQNIENNNILINVNKKIKRKYIAIAIATSGPEKFWTLENYIKVINYFFEKGFKYFLLLSGKNQSVLESNICNFFNSKNINFIRTSNLTIEKIIPYLKRTKIYFGNDTGFSHLAASYQIPSIVIFGECEPFNDYSKFIYPIIPKNKIFTKNSIKEISFEHVKNKIKIFLNKNNL
jgi:ADP-heptose:LPS heptosyltransferase